MEFLGHDRVFAVGISFKSFFENRDRAKTELCAHTTTENKETKNKSSAII